MWKEAHVDSGFNTPLPHPAKALPSLAKAMRRAQRKVNPADSSLETRSAAAEAAGETLHLPKAMRAGRAGAADAPQGPPRPGVSAGCWGPQGRGPWGHATAPDPVLARGRRGH